MDASATTTAARSASDRLCSVESGHWSVDRFAEQAAMATVRRRVGDALSRADDLLNLIDPAWRPPPYDPLLVAQALGIRCVRMPSLSPAALLCKPRGQLTILYREMRSPERTRFNLFHEIAHTLFPNFGSHPFLSRQRPRLFEPAGRLEKLCDAAALEFMMPGDLFEEDLIENGFGAGRVPELCKRFAIWPEATALRMIDSDLECCALAFVDFLRLPRRQRAGLAGEPTHSVSWSVCSNTFQQRRLVLPRHLNADRHSALNVAARTKKLMVTEEVIRLASGDDHLFMIEAMPVTDKRRHGRNPLLVLLYPK